MTWARYRKEDSVFNEKIKELEEEHIDEAEENMRLLRQGIPKLNRKGEIIGWKVKPHFGALLKFLESKARDRGWGTLVVLNGDTEDISTMSDKEIAEKALRFANELDKRDLDEEEEEED